MRPKVTVNVLLLLLSRIKYPKNSFYFTQLCTILINFSRTLYQSWLFHNQDNYWVCHLKTWTVKKKNLSNGDCLSGRSRSPFLEFSQFCNLSIVQPHLFKISFTFTFVIWSTSKLPSTLSFQFHGFLTLLYVDTPFVIVFFHPPGSLFEVSERTKRVLEWNSNNDVFIPVSILDLGLDTRVSPDSLDVIHNLGRHLTDPPLMSLFTCRSSYTRLDSWRWNPWRTNPGFWSTFLLIPIPGFIPVYQNKLVNPLSLYSLSLRLRFDEGFSSKHPYV